MNHWASCPMNSFRPFKEIKRRIESVKHLREVSLGL